MEKTDITRLGKTFVDLINEVQKEPGGACLMFISGSVIADGKDKAAIMFGASGEATSIMTAMIKGCVDQPHIRALILGVADALRNPQTMDDFEKSVVADSENITDKVMGKPQKDNTKDINVN